MLLVRCIFYLVSVSPKFRFWVIISYPDSWFHVSPWRGDYCSSHSWLKPAAAVCWHVYLVLAVCTLSGVCFVVNLKKGYGFIFTFNLETKSMKYSYTLAQSYFDYFALYLLWIFLLFYYSGFEFSYLVCSSVLISDKSICVFVF